MTVAESVEVAAKLVADEAMRDYDRKALTPKEKRLAFDMTQLIMKRALELFAQRLNVHQ